MRLIADNRIRFLIIALLAVVVYLPLLLVNTVNPDAQFIFPILAETQSLEEYFQKLLQFQTLDFQPIRDLSLFVDWKIFESFGINLTVFQNVIIWSITGWFIDRILSKLFTTLDDQERLLIVLAFVSYPLFTQSVAWGIARKHLLAMMFTLIATERVIATESFKLKDSVWISLSYLFAVLSQPIALLWPFWAMIYVWFSKKNLLKVSAGALLPSFFIFALMTYINFIYYQSSPVFLGSYAAKTDEVLEISDKILALGHYVFQLFFPYLMSFVYTLGHWSTLGGLMVLGAFTYLILGLKVDKKTALIWAIFSFFPLAIVLQKSTMLFDTYLLLPGFGILVLLIALKEKLPNFQYKKIAYGILILGWATFSFYEAKGWKNELVLVKRSFSRRPSCLSAHAYLKTHYENGLRPSSPDAKRFIFNQECNKFSVRGQSLINLQANLLYYENDLPESDRRNNLEKLSELGIFPHMALIALHINNHNNQEALAAISSMVSRWGHQRFKPEYILLAAKVIFPFCRKNKEEKCLKVLEPFIEKKADIFYK